VGTGPGLRERKKQRTREHLIETARRLFAARGFEQVSVVEIAREAKVAPATVFNYFPTKEDLVFHPLEQFEERLLEAIRGRPAGESVLEAFGRFILEPGGFFAAPDEAAARERMELAAMITRSPSLKARERQIVARSAERLAALIAAEIRAPAGDLRPRVTATAMIGLHHALIAYVRERLADGERDRRRLARDVRRRGDAALALLAHGLGDYARKRSSKRSREARGSAG